MLYSSPRWPLILGPHVFSFAKLWRVTKSPFHEYRSSHVVCRATFCMASMTPGQRSKCRAPLGSNEMMSPKRVISSMEAAFSSIIGVWPLRSHSMAAARPAKPAPTMMTLMPDGGLEGNHKQVFEVSEASWDYTDTLTGRDVGSGNVSFGMRCPTSKLIGAFPLLY
jgi:hypothetical protein